MLDAGHRFPSEPAISQFESKSELFLKFMTQHHEGALTMVDALMNSQGSAQDDVIFKFASDVQVDQSTEIARMEKMLAALTFGISIP